MPKIRKASGAATVKRIITSSDPRLCVVAARRGGGVDWQLRAPPRSIKAASASRRR